MKKLLYGVLFLVVCSGASEAIAQGLIDTANFSVVATIKPSDYPGVWPDSIGAWRVYGPYDINKNGKKEFFVIVDPTAGGVNQAPIILQFEASGNNTYDLIWHTQIPEQNTLYGSWPCLAVADVDKNGEPELIVGVPSDARATDTSPNQTPNIIFFYQYDSTSKKLPTDPTLMSGLDLPPGFNFSITSIVPVDVDKDGDVELIVSARRYRSASVGDKRPLFIYHLNGDVDNGFTALVPEFADTIGTFNGGYYFNNHVVDFDGNGKLEIWGFTWDMLSYAVYEATAKDTYVLKADINQAANPDDYGEQNSVGFYDANHDGKLEMFFGGQVSPPSAVWYLPNTSDLTSLSTSSTVKITAALDNANFQGMEVGDIDGDGEVDMVIGDWAVPVVYHVEHIAGQPYNDPSGYKLDTLYASDSSTYAFPNVNIMDDLDGDGKKEVILVNANTRGGVADAGLIILESKVVVTNVKTIANTAPASFQLEQNYPNPFNPSSTIRFSLKTAANVELTVTNSAGQQVAKLLNKRMEIGTHEVTFNADGLASGAYFYTLRAGNIVQTKKMLLMK